MKKAKLCVYCGDVATTRDHVVPYLYAGKYSGKRRGGSDAGITVPACKSCNSGLGSKLFYTMEDRVNWVRRWRKQRGLPILAIGEAAIPLPVRKRRKRVVAVLRSVEVSGPAPLRAPINPFSVPPDKALGLAAIFL